MSIKDVTCGQEEDKIGRQVVHVVSPVYYILRYPVVCIFSVYWDLLHASIRDSSEYASE